MGVKNRIAARVPETTLRRALRLRHGESPALGRLVARTPSGDAEPLVVEDFDAHAARRRIGQDVMTALARHGVPFVAVPGAHGQVAQVAVGAEWRGFAQVTLATELPHHQQAPVGLRRTGTGVVRVHRDVVAPDGTMLGGPELACEVAFWAASTRPHRRPDGGTHPVGTYLAPNANGVVGHLAREAWDRAVASPTHWVDDPVRPSVLEVTEPVDVVYTWVDGADPAWQQRRAAHEPAASANASASHAARYLSRDELRYSLRSVAMFARWVRRIFVVTDAQVPDWLDTTHPQIEVIDHRAIFRDPAVLPVFNSHAIESQLHHIDGLSERYLYLNDDVFLGRAVDPELFFHAHGPAAFFLSPNTLDVDAPSADESPATRAAKNGGALLARDFGVHVAHKFKHGVHPQQRSVLADLESRYPAEFARTAAARFRSSTDLAVASSFGHYFGAVTGRAVPASMASYEFVDISRADAPRRLDSVLRRRPQVFCINEAGTTELSSLPQLQQFLDLYFPVKSPYEKR